MRKKFKVENKGFAYELRGNFLQSCSGNSVAYSNCQYAGTILKRQESIDTSARMS